MPPQEVKLADNRTERDLQDSLAEIFSIIVTLDELEKAFLKDAIPEADYTEICERSLKQYNAILADETVMRAFVGLEEFKAEWDVCFFPSALRWSYHRLIKRSYITNPHRPTDSSKSPAPLNASAWAWPRPPSLPPAAPPRRRPRRHRATRAVH